MQSPNILVDHGPWSGGAQEVHPHFHGISAEDVAAIIARVNREGRERVY